jgi:hypothetical protein
VHDARPFRIAAGRADGLERARERALEVTGAGMNDDPRRLVDDDEVLVLVRDAQLELDRVERTRRLREFELDLVTLLDAVTLRARRAADRDGAALEQPLRVGARPNGLLGREEAVEPLPGSVSGDAYANDRRARRPRSADRPRRR